MVNEDLLRTLFVKKSLKNNPEGGFQIQMKNSISDATIIEPIKIEISSETIGKEKYKDFEVIINEEIVKNQDISQQNPANFTVKALATLNFSRDDPLPIDKYKIRFIRLLTEEYGDLPFSMKERIRE